VSWERVHSNLVLGDQQCGSRSGSCLYQATVSGSTATVTGTTRLKSFDGTNCDVVLGSLSRRNPYFAGPCITATSGIAAKWPYPTGGKPTDYSTNVFYLSARPSALDKEASSCKAFSPSLQVLASRSSATATAQVLRLRRTSSANGCPTLPRSSMTRPRRSVVGIKGGSCEGPSC
jgi:hypothetical protein